MTARPARVSQPCASSRLKGQAGPTPHYSAFFPAGVTSWHTGQVAWPEMQLSRVRGQQPRRRDGGQVNAAIVAARHMEVKPVQTLQIQGNVPVQDVVDCDRHRPLELLHAQQLR
ncbi:MAG: hypothetical protein ACRDPY_42035 [Streptosporangiaceae bacterium]